MIFLEIYQKPPTWCSYVEWSKGRLKTVTKQKKLTLLEGPMHRGASGGQSHKKSSQKHMKSTTCNYFNAGTCSHNKTHETRGILYKRLCSACFPMGKAYSHPETECRSKNKKNFKKSKYIWLGILIWSPRSMKQKCINPQLFQELGRT